MNLEQEQKAENNTLQESNKTATEMRQERIMQIDNDLQSFNYQAKTPKVMQAIQSQRLKDYESKIADLENGLGQTLSNESRQSIYKNEVEALMNQALNENKRFDELSNEKTVLEYLSHTLDNENPKSFIESPMNHDCKVAVMIPACNESPQEILMSLSSLAKQEGIDTNLFEIDFIVNNPKIDAEQKSQKFLTNQESIKLLKYINGTLEEIPIGLTDEQITEIDNIKKAEIKINVIDKSSIETSDDENNVGIARNRAGAEIVARFLETSKKTSGIISITDCDCTFSPNYIKTLIGTFENNSINGVSGNLEFEVDPEMTNKELVQNAFDIYMGIDRTIDKAKKYEGQENFVPTPGALKAGADMAVTAKAWSLAGGMPKFVGGEDIRFGKNIEALKGRVAKNYGYTVTSLIRVSERTGLQGNGRIVKKIKESVDDFVSGKSDKIYVEDREMVDTFFSSLDKASKNNNLSGDFIIKMMNECKFKLNTIPKEDYDDLAGKINIELQKHPSKQDMNKIQDLILKKIYPYYPERDVTNQITNKEEK